MRRLFTLPLLAIACLPASAFAQSSLDGRVGKLESEMRAVQRKVFPGGAGQYLQPEITAAPAPREPLPGEPASSPVADLSARVSSLEGQVASMTGAVEEQGHRLRQLQDEFDAYRRATDARLAAAAQPAPVPMGGMDEAPPPMAAPPRATPRGPAPRPQPAAAPDDTGAPDTAAVDKPSTGDPAEDAYLYGYRLWAAHQYPQAETQLKKVVAQYPQSRRASYAQNLLGRSYLDDGKPSLASMAFYDNYKKMPDGERAPDSLYYLAQALMKLDKPADACKVYDELTDVYGGKIAAGMKADVARGRIAAKCK